LYGEGVPVIQRLGVPVLTVILVLALAGCGGGAQQGSSDPDPLRVGLVPNQNPEKVQAEYAPFGDYLSEQLGREVELQVPTSYNAVVEAMANDQLDMAYFGGLTYVQARERADVSPLVTEINPYTHTTKYHSLIIAPADGSVQSVEDINGKTFAFGSVSSTSGSLYPAIMLQDAVIDYRTDLEEKTYTGGHDATAQAVQNGRVDAGGIEDRILYNLEKDGTIDENAVRTVEESSPIEGYPWVVRDALSDDLKEEIVQAFLNIEDPTLLDLLRAEGYERVEAGDYDYVEEKARELDLLTAR